MNGGRVSKAGNNVTLTTNVVKGALELELTPEERRVEEAYESGELARAAGWR